VVPGPRHPGSYGEAGKNISCPASIARGREWVSRFECISGGECHSHRRKEGLRFENADKRLGDQGVALLGVKS
jgi:hypothetical protein